MNRNPLKKGMIEENSVEIGEISEEMVAKRARDLALIAGHTLTKGDYDQALRELSGEDEMDPKEAQLESAPEDDRWDPVHGSRGYQAEESVSEEDDEDGRGASAQLVEEGVREAEHDQMLRAAKASKNQNPYNP